MAAINKIGFDYDAMDKTGEKWESPEDIINYVRAGLKFLVKTSGSTDLEIMDKQKRWIEYSKQAMDCLVIIE